MSKRNKTLELLRGLLAERQQFEQWLSALANKRADTPGAVYERVSQDYQSRLDSVLDRLQSHTQDLQGSMSELTQQLAEVTERETGKREAQQEAELRAAVGEFAAERWDEMRRDAELELKKIGQERSGIESQLVELSGILELTQGRTPSADFVQLPNVTVHTASKQEVVHENAPAPHAPKAGVTRAAADLGGAREDAIFPNWSESDQNQAKGTPVAEPRSKTAPARPETEKTLKCQECQSLNFPTEWYCEKCGSELATL